MQRLHNRDLTAVCLELGFEHLCLPALAPGRTTIEFPRSGRTVNREVDDPLWPARENRVQLDAQARVLGSYGFAGQYQQNPIPRTGGMFPRDWWRWFDRPPDRFDEVLQSWDLSFRDGDGSDYVVGLVAGRIGAHVYLLARYTGKASFVETLHEIQKMIACHPRTSVVLIEDAANGPAVVSALHQHVPGIIAVKPDGGKVARASAVQPQIEAGQVWLPSPRWTDGAVRPEYVWVEDFVDTCAAFPKGDHDDDVDALSQLLLRCRTHTGLSAGEIIRSMLEDTDDSESDDEHYRGHDLRYRGYKVPEF